MTDRPNPLTGRRAGAARMKKALGVSLAMFLACAAPPPARAENSRPELLLDGTWEFKTDPNNEGGDGSWLEPSVAYEETIEVPGNWQAQGIGNPSGIARHDYQGKAWFRRTFAAPAEWSGRRLWIRFEGVSNWGEVYVNGVPVGRVETFITPYEFDVTDKVRFGEDNRLHVVVDSATPPNTPYLGMMQFLVKVGGITSHVRLEARPDPWLDRVAVRAGPELNAVWAAVCAKRCRAGAPWQERVCVHVLAANGDLAAEGEMPIAFAAASEASDPAEVRISVPGLRLWSPEDPYLYRVEVDLLDAAGTLDQKILRTGFRTLVTDEQNGNFVLNGHNYFLRGCGYDSLEPLCGSPPPVRQVYVERLRHLKQYGFNAVRFLAHTPLAEFFEAADEVGLLVQTEGEWFLGGTPMAPQTAELFKSQVPRMIREHENHPSWFSFSCFNEAFNAQHDAEKQDYIQSAWKTFRAMKPDHFFVASDGGGDQWPTDIITDRAAMGRADAPDAPAATEPQQVFRGLVDEVALFHTTLDDPAMRRLADDADGPEAYGRRVLELRPAAYWRLDATEPGVIRDESGRGCDGRYDPNTELRNAAVSGRMGGAIHCGATGGAIPGLSLRAVAEKALPPRGGSFSLSFWIWPDGFAENDYGTPFSCGAAETGRALILALNGEQGDGRLLIGRYFDNILKSQRALAAGQWSHVGLVYDGRRLRLWLDGRPDAELQANLDLPPRDLAIGRLIAQTLRKPEDYRSRPHVWHEFNNTYIAPLPDLEIERRLSGAMTQAWVLEPHRRRLEKYGLLDRYPELRARSVDLYREYVKQAFESARRMPRLDGYSWWVVSDIPGGVETDVTSYGVLDMLYQPEKFPDRSWFLQFNGESVLLVDKEIDQRVFSSGETRSLKLFLAHYGTKPVEDGRVAWRVTFGDRLVQEGRLEGVQAEPGGLRELGSITLGPWNSPAAEKGQLDLALDSLACRATNRWKLWMFPPKKQVPTAGLVVDLTGEPRIAERYASSGTGNLEDASLVLASKVTPELMRYLCAGGRVILLDQNAERSAVSRPAVIHDSRRPEPQSAVLRQPGVLPYWAHWLRCNAQIVEPSAALGDLPHDGFCDFQLMRLFGSAVATVDFTPRASIARGKVRPIIWGLSLVPWAEDASPFNYALAYGGVLTECRVEQGGLLILNLYLLEGLRRDYPEAGYLLDCIVSYALSDQFSPPSPPLSSAEAERLLRIDQP